MMSMPQRSPMAPITAATEHVIPSNPLVRITSHFVYELDTRTIS